jgi:hypothetical protein
MKNAIRSHRTNDSHRSNYSDRSGVVIETLESRRLLSADLSAQFAGKIPAILPAEGKTQITLRITNIGDAPAKGMATIQLAASADSNLDASDVLLTTTNKRLSLKPGKGMSVKLRVPAPRSLASGDYVLIAQVSGEATATDSKAENNIAASSASVQVQNAFVDFAAQNVGVPQPSGNVAEKVSVQVKNLGNVTARGAVTVSWYLSNDTALDGSDILIAAMGKRVKIAPGKSQVLSVPAVLGSNVPLGQYHLLALIAPAPAMGDANAANNLAVAPTTVQVVQPPPQPRGHEHEHGHDQVSEIVGETYYEEVYVVEYVDTGLVSVAPEDGGADEVTMQPPEGEDAPADVPASDPSVDVSTSGPPDVPVMEPPATQPADEPPTSQPSDEPTTQPAPDPPPSDTSGGGSDVGGDYNSSGGDF